MAGLSKQIVAVPVMAGLDESIDERQLGADGFAKLTNCVMRKRDVWSKRRGFSIAAYGSAVAWEDPGGGGQDPGGGGAGGGSSNVDITRYGPVRAMHSTGRELLVVGSQRLYALNEENRRFVDKGAVSPFVGKSQRVFHGLKHYRSSDAAADYKGTYVLHAAIAYSKLGSGDDYVDHYFAEVTATTTDGDVVMARSILIETTLIANRPHSIRCCGLLDKIIVIIGVGGGSGEGAAALKLYEWDPATPHVPPTLVREITDNLFCDDDFLVGNAGTTRRFFDCVPAYRGTNYIVSWINHDDSLVSYEMNTSAHSTLHSDDGIAGACLTFATYTDNEVSPGTATALYLAKVSSDANPLCQVRTFSYNLASLSAEGLATIYELTSEEEFPRPECGIIAGTDPFGFSVILGLFGLHFTPSDDSQPEYPYIVYGTTDLATDDVIGPEIIYNAVLTSKPFVVRNRFYAAVSGTGPDEPFTYNAIYDFDARRDGITPRPRLAGLYDIGTGRNGTMIGGVSEDTRNDAIGSCNTVTIFGEVVRFASTSIAAYAYTAEDSDLSKLAQDLVTLDFAAPVVVDTVFDGAAVVGGGYVSWYSGHETFELGFPTAPGFFQDPVDANDAFVATMYESADSAGFLHRGPVFPATGCDTEGTVEFYAFTYPCTLRDRVNVAYFSANAGSTLRRLQNPFEVDLNISTSEITEGIDAALGATSAPPMYTDGGVLEGISPEGARLVRMAFGRVWLSDFFRGHRIQWSKSVAPGTPEETAIAPEFNTSFGRVSPSAEEFTGIAELDDQLVLFTRSRIYVIAGSGPNNLGVGDFSPLRAVMTDTGCTDFRSVVEYQDGVLFRGERGIYRLDRTGGVRFLGFPVIDETDAYPTVTSARLNASAGEIYFTCTTEDGKSGIVLVYNYIFNAWSKWELRGEQGELLAFVSAAMHQGTYYLLEKNGRVWAQRSDTFLDAGVLYVPMAVEIGWAKSSAWQRVSDSIPLLARKDGFDLRVEMFADFEGEAFKDETIVDSELLDYEQPATRLQPRVSITRQECQAYKVRLSDSSAGSTTTTGEGFTFSGLLLQIGSKRGVPRLPGTQRA